MKKEMPLGVSYLAITAFSLWPSLNFISANIEIGIDKSAVFLAGGIFWVLFTGGYTFATLVFRKINRNRLVAFFCLSSILLFSLNVVQKYLFQYQIDLSILLVWGVLSILVVGFGTWIVTDYRRTIILTAIGGTAVSVAVVSIVIQLAAVGKIAGIAMGPASSGINSESSFRPNIYYLLLDSYSRSDQIRKYAGFDNSPFEDGLREKGFRVLEKAHSNYFFTDLSVPSLLSMQYYNDGKGRKINSSAESLTIMHGPNAVYDRLRDLGYRILVTGSKLCNRDVDKCLVEKNGFSPDAWTYLQTSPLPVAISYLSTSLHNRLSLATIPTVEKLDPIIQNLRGAPLLVLMHSFEVHDSIYDSNCNVRESLARDNQERLNFDDRRLQKISIYVESLKCTNRNTLNMVSNIVEKDPGAIIVITADHGIRYTVQSTPEIDREIVNQRTAVFSAWRMPSRCLQILYETISVVNYFRTIFSCIDNRSPEYIEDKILTGESLDEVTPFRPI